MAGRNNSRNAGGTATQYVDAIKDSVNDLARICEALEAQGLALSAQISFGRILSVGVRPQRTWGGAAKSEGGDAPEVEVI
jgi:hypothetical protein